MHLGLVVIATALALAGCGSTSPLIDRGPADVVSVDASSDAQFPDDASIEDASGDDAGEAQDASLTDAAIADAGADAGTDAGEAQDASVMDAAIADAGEDAGTPCTCTSGPCCDGCYFKPANTPCSPKVVTTYCENKASSSEPTIVVTETTWNICSGTSVACTDGAGSDKFDNCQQHGAGSMCIVGVDGVAHCT